MLTSLTVPKNAFLSKRNSTACSAKSSFKSRTQAFNLMTSTDMRSTQYPPPTVSSPPPRIPSTSCNKGSPRSLGKRFTGSFSDPRQSSWGQRSEIELSPHKPSKTMRIFATAENFPRVLRWFSSTCLSAEPFDPVLILISHLRKNDDERCPHSKTIQPALRAVKGYAEY